MQTSGTAWPESLKSPASSTRVAPSECVSSMTMPSGASEAVEGPSSPPFHTKMVGSARALPAETHRALGVSVAIRVGLHACWIIDISLDDDGGDEL